MICCSTPSAVSWFPTEVLATQRNCVAGIQVPMVPRLAFFQCEKTRRHELGDPLLYCGKIVGTADPAREAIDAARAPQGGHQGAGYKVVAPKNIRVGIIGQRLLQQVDELEDNRV